MCQPHGCSFFHSSVVFESDPMHAGVQISIRFLIQQHASRASPSLKCHHKLHSTTEEVSRRRCLGMLSLRSVKAQDLAPGCTQSNGCFVYGARFWTRTLCSRIQDFTSRIGSHILYRHSQHACVPKVYRWCSSCMRPFYATTQTGRYASTQNRERSSNLP